MDPDQQRIEEDLRGLVHGDVRCDDVFTQLYATDASIYEQRPLGVVRPRTIDDVVAIVRYAAENQLPLHARGAGTGLTGAALGRGIVVDFSRYFRRILGDDEDQLRVQPGVVLDSLNRYLQRSGRLFGPDPAMRSVTTMGSVLAVDAAGSHWPRYGSARHHVESLQIVLADGALLQIGKHPVGRNGNGARPEPNDLTSRLNTLIESVAGLINRHAKTIEDRRPLSPVNSSGYRLDDVLNDGQLDLAKLLVGSEGTLGLITEATVTVDPLPLHRSCVLLLFESLDQAAHAALEIAAMQPAACDLMDRRHLSLARETDVRYELLIPGEAEAILLVEYHAESREELQYKLDEVVELVQYKLGLAAASHVAEDEVDFQLYWGLAQRFTPTLFRMQGSSRPTPGVEDIAVPVAALPVFLRHVQDTLKRLQVTASLFGHAAQGQLHIRPFLDLLDAHDVRTMELLAAELYEKVWLLRGTISGEHGDGLSRTPFLAKQYGPLVNVFRELKQIFDPQGILNPGKIVPTAPSRMTQHIRASAVRLPAVDASANITANDNGHVQKLPELEFKWSVEEMATAARACNGCGACRTASSDTRMCPIFRMNPREESSPRAKANLVRGLLTGKLPDDTLLQDLCKEVADLCVHCHMCRLECPSNVDIPKLMLEAKAAYVNTNGLTLHSRLLTRIDTLAALAGRLPGIANWALRNPTARWLLEKAAGIAQGRKLPRLARRSFLQQSAMRRLHHPPRTSGEKIVYFVDTYANHFDTQLGDALVAVMRHNGVAVFVSQDQLHAGMTMIAAGALEPARIIAAQNVSKLAESVRQGYTIVATEPSAVLALTHEYPALLDNDEDALVVAQHTQEACHYLWQLHLRGRLKLDFQPQRISVGYHVPCHLRALGVGAPAENLLRLIPGVRVNRIEKGCSGMAGLWGIKRENYRASLRAGLELISTVRDGPFQIGTTECSTCKMQMEQGSAKPTVHPIKLLALAYGLMPEVMDAVRSGGKPLVVS
ncbi:MAG TPA: anaerobic glycerol-3-phosphate dehydrogenase subunit C [Lacipirellulaceae bacterium]|nr:anaerobic glycerol-3-phosphate dehydrogenase subunit C [Lacipirellulaceae bacterium]